MSVTVFSSGDDVIQRRIDCQPSIVKADHLDEVFEINRCIAWITEGGFERVALQFPDELLPDAPLVASQIQMRLQDAVVFILGDTSYGSCCVDEVGAEHYKADCIVHFGQACLSPTGRLPVLYIFGRSVINIENCVHQLTELCSNADMKAVLMYDTIYSYAMGEIFLKLQPIFTNLVLSGLAIPRHIPAASVDQDNQSNCCLPSSISDHMHEKHLSQNQVHPQSQEQTVASSLSAVASCSSLINKCGRTIEIPSEEDIESYSFIFIGDTEGAALTNMMMNFNRCPFYSYNPVKNQCQRETLNVNKALMKRYYLIERAKDANIVGIVVGTLGVTKYRNVIEYLKSILKKAGKKSYIFAVGKLNPAKLANFAEVDIYVLVACPESTLLNQTEFYRPVVSPLEMDIACNQAREWTGEYSTDFKDILPGASMHVENQGTSEDDGGCKTDVSLISNRVRVLGIKETPEVGAIPGHDLLLRSEALAVASVAANAGEYLASRTWKGLEQNLGETPITKAIEGQHGIAASYQHESVGL